MRALRSASGMAASLYGSKWGIPCQPSRFLPLNRAVNPFGGCGSPARVLAAVTRTSSRMKRLREQAVAVRIGPLQRKAVGQEGMSLVIIRGDRGPSQDRVGVPALAG